MMAEHLLPRVLRPRTTRQAPRGLFPSRESNSANSALIPVSEKVYEPFFRRWAERFSRLRILQQGKVNVYLVYIVFMVVLALAWVSLPGVLECVMSEWLVVCWGSSWPPRAACPAFSWGRGSMGGQWVTTLLAVLASGLGLGGVVWFWASGEQPPDRAALVHPRRRVQRGHRRPVGHLPRAGLPDLASGQHLRAGLLEADRSTRENGRKLRLFYGTMTAGMALLVIARNGILFLFGWEIMALSAFFLVTTEDEKKDVREAGWIYLVATHTATLCLFALFALLHAVNGSFSLAPLDAGALTPGVATAIFVLVACGIRLEGRHHAAARLAAQRARGRAQPCVGDHVGRPHQDGHLRPGPGDVAAGRSAAELGRRRPGAGRGLGRPGGGVRHRPARPEAAAGVPQHREHRHHRDGAGPGPDRPFARSRGLGRPRPGRRLLHVWNHALFKALLFLSAGSVIHAVHTRDIDHLGGLAKPMPWTSLCFLVGAVAICGLPPLNGFVSEFLIYLGLFGTLASGAGPTFAGAAFAAPALALIGALAVACFVKVYGRSSWDCPLGTRSACARVAAEHARADGRAGRLLLPDRAGPDGSSRRCCEQGISAWAPRLSDAGLAPRPLAPLDWITAWACCWSRPCRSRPWCYGSRLRSHAGGQRRHLGLRLPGTDSADAVHLVLVRPDAGRDVRLGAPSADRTSPADLPLFPQHGRVSTATCPTRCSTRPCCRRSVSAPGCFPGSGCFSRGTSRPTCCTSSSP